MDRQSTVAAAARSADTVVQVDRAIFTSIRTPTGEGYRIVAASAGVRADEKKEVTQRSPSHGSLCNPAPTAVALSCYPLRSGRYCVADSRHAGVEHTARGGQRVYTHIALLDDDAFRRFDCNPLRVRAALAETLPDEPLLKPPPRLDGLSLATGSSDAGADVPAEPILSTPAAADLVAYLVSSVLEGRPLIAVGGRRPFELLEWTVIGLPLYARRNLAASIGLNFSRPRRMQLTWIDRDQGQTRPAARGTDIEWLDVESGPPPGDSRLGPWPKLIRRWLSERRLRDIHRLASQLSADDSASSLERIASVCNDLDRVEDADPAVRLDYEAGAGCVVVAALSAPGKSARVLP